MNGKLSRTAEADRVSELLGLPEEINDTCALETEVANGLPPASVSNILATMYTRPSINLISDRAYRRAKQANAPLSRANSQLIYDFARAYVAADERHAGNGAMVMRFFERPNVDLGGAAPIQLATSSPAGADAVIELLNALEVQDL